MIATGLHVISLVIILQCIEATCKTAIGSPSGWILEKDVGIPEDLLRGQDTFFKFTNT